jgi:hypothetical protein
MQAGLVEPRNAKHPHCLDSQYPHNMQGEKTIKKNIHSNNEEGNICARTPAHSTDFALERPPLYLTTHQHLPKAHNTRIIPSESPRSIRTDTQCSHTSLFMQELQRPICRERPQTRRTGELRHQTLRIDIEFDSLHTRSKIQVQLSIEPFLNEAVISRHQPKRSVFLW